MTGAAPTISHPCPPTPEGEAKDPRTPASHTEGATLLFWEQLVKQRKVWESQMCRRSALKEPPDPGLSKAALGKGPKTQELHHLLQSSHRSNPVGHQLHSIG